MKVIIAGATGFVGSELVRQSLRMSQITSVVALSRKPIKFEDGTDVSKLKNVVLKDYGEYPDDVKKEFAGAGACIWYVSRSRVLPWLMGIA
jgi:nucleoside-diphosphate-sugar epimerase